MFRALLPYLNTLVREALLALIRTHQKELASQQDELHSLHAEFDSHRKIVSERAEELHTPRSLWIEHIKLMIEERK